MQCFVNSIVIFPVASKALWLLLKVNINTVSEKKVQEGHFKLVEGMKEHLVKHWMLVLIFQGNEHEMGATWWFERKQ